MKTTLKLRSPSTGFLLGSSTSFEGLEVPSAYGLTTAGYHNGSYSLSTAAWNIGLTVSLFKSDGTQLELPEGVLVILPDVLEVKVQGPVIRIPAKSIALKEEKHSLVVTDSSSTVLFRIIKRGNLAFIINSEAVPKVTDWNHLVQASSTLKKVIDSCVGKSEEQQEQILLNYISEIKRTVACFGTLCDNIKEPNMHRITTYRLDVTSFAKTTSLYLYQKENDYSAVEPIFETAFRDMFPDIKSMAVFLRKLNYLEDNDFGVEVQIEYLQKQTYLEFSLHISSMILPERAMSALSMNRVFRA